MTLFEAIAFWIFIVITVAFFAWLVALVIRK